MEFCSKCGSVIADGSSFCEICGHAIDRDTQGAMSYVSSRPATKEESINLCNTLASKYASYEKIKEEIHDLEFSVKKMEVPSHPPRYSFFRFFWPFFIIALVACFFSTLIVGFMFISVYDDYGEVLARAAGYLSIPIVLIIGVIVAKAKQKRANDKLAENEEAIFSRISTMRAQINELKTQQNQISDELQYYKDLIPMNMRNKNSILKVKRMLELSQAETIEQAIEMVMHPARI